MAGFHTTEEVLNHRDRSHIATQGTTVTSNSITVTIAAVAGKKHYITNVMLSGTTGGGAAEALTLKRGSTTAWTETFTVGTDKDRPFYGDGFVGNVGEAVSVVASATSLSAGRLSVIGFTK